MERSMLQLSSWVELICYCFFSVGFYFKQYRCISLSLFTKVVELIYNSKLGVAFFDYGNNVKKRLYNWENFMIMGGENENICKVK